jgi:hypothetical protein
MRGVPGHKGRRVVMNEMPGAERPPTGTRSERDFAQPVETDAALDEALDESFPASDPVAIHIDETREEPPPAVERHGK